MFSHYRHNRTLIVQNVITNAVVIRREEHDTASAARITKGIYALMIDGKHVAFYEHTPNKFRKPQIINGRYYAKPIGKIK